MITELEKQFFDTFGIEPNTTGYELKQIKENVRGLIRVPVSEYPQITDRHYLELICALNNADKDVSIFNSRKLDRLKDEILFDCIGFFEEIGTEEACQRLRHQVQAIFEGER